MTANGNGTKYYGKYRGAVVNNVDPLKQGRLMVTVPDVSITPSTWAMPCVPVAGLQMGALSIPPIGAGVWIEFEQGDPDYPIWVGGWWGSAAEIPALAQTVPPPVSGFVFQTLLQNGLLISDVPGPTGGIMLKTMTGATITMNDTGIVLQNGKGASIAMVGPTITINNGALTIT
jgi:uncharacterized protein involved in type VI secretion and phage assembly